MRYPIQEIKQFFQPKSTAAARRHLFFDASTDTSTPLIPIQLTATSRDLTSQNRHCADAPSKSVSQTLQPWMKASHDFAIDFHPTKPVLLF